MVNSTEVATDKRQGLFSLQHPRQIKVPISTKFTMSFLLVITLISVVFMVFGVQLINNLILSEAQEKVRNDLNAAREIYLGNLTHIHDVVRLTADRFFLRDALVSGNIEVAREELISIKNESDLDFLAVTDKYGYVLMRTGNPGVAGDNQGHDQIVRSALHREETVAATIIVQAEDLQNESALLAEKAHFEFIDTPLARERDETEENAGMMLKAAAPIYDARGDFLGVIYGGVLLNRNFEIVDKVKQTVYENVKYEGQDIGTATIFQDDLRISTNVRNVDGSRAIGTRVSEEVYNQVVIKGEPWIDRAYVVNNWYITAYEPIRDVYDRIIGILYVGILEEKYSDIQKQSVITFLVIAAIGAVVTMTVSYLVGRQILRPISNLVSASEDVASGNLDARVEISTNDELQILAESFNEMSLALKKRDEQFKDFATQRIMESERLALVGQLSANIAHELNNPLQGIVTFSHLLLEDSECKDATTQFSLEKIVGQANRCRDIIRGLLDFSRQRKPDKTLINVNEVIHECISLVEHQALFHNIEVILHLQDDLPMAIIDASQIERVFINMIINAAEAMEGSGHLSISTRYGPRRDCVEIAFQDTGPGISEGNLKKIFDPFFTTKDVGHGTGLGLAISYGIVRSHRGTINVNSTEGQGTTFIIALPVNNGKDLKHGRSTQNSNH